MYKRSVAALSINLTEYPSRVFTREAHSLEQSLEVATELKILMTSNTVSELGWALVGRDSIVFLSLVLLKLQYVDLLKVGLFKGAEEKNLISATFA